MPNPRILVPVSRKSERLASVVDAISKFTAYYRNLLCLAISVFPRNNAFKEFLAILRTNSFYFLKECLNDKPL